MTMAAITYLLCAATCMVCFVLLLRSWLATRHKLLFWTALCFAGLTLNNTLLVLDKLVFADIDLIPYRLAAAVVAMAVLVFGLVWEA